MNPTYPIIEQIALDAAEKPLLFYLTRSPIDASFNEWLESNHLAVPDELWKLWQEIGWGDLFESETLLTPSSREDEIDGIGNRTEFHRERGLDRDYLIVHIGLGGLTALNTAHGTYDVIDDRQDYRITEAFPTLSRWYFEGIHAEYAARYGLQSV